MTKLEQAARQALGALEVATTPLAKDRQEVLRAITTLREALSGVQALSAAPEAIAKLRHLYQNMVNGAVRDTASAKRIAEGLLAPAIEALERATPPAEQQAAPKAAPDHPPMPENWGVVVSVNSENILCIGQDYLHGKRELSEAEELAIVGMAQHLLAFVGYGLPPSIFDPDDDAAPQQEAQEPTAISEAIERMAADRYKVVPSHESMFHRWAVVAGTGTQQLYLGREVECQNMARKFAGAFLDGAFVAMQRTAPQPAPAPLIARSLAEWHEQDGNVAWWAWNGREWAGEPAWIGTPNCEDWPGYHTHWTPHPEQPVCTALAAQGDTP